MANPLFEDVFPIEHSDFPTSCQFSGCIFMPLPLTLRRTNSWTFKMLLFFDIISEGEGYGLDYCWREDGSFTSDLVTFQLLILPFEPKKNMDFLHHLHKKQGTSTSLSHVVGSTSKFEFVHIKMALALCRDHWITHVRGGWNNDGNLEGFPSSLFVPLFGLLGVEKSLN